MTTIKGLKVMRDREELYLEYAKAAIAGASLIPIKASGDQIKTVIEGICASAHLIAVEMTKIYFDNYNNNTESMEGCYERII